MLKGYIDAYWVKNSNMKKSPNQNGKKFRGRWGNCWNMKKFPNCGWMCREGLGEYLEWQKTPNAGENVIVMRCHSHYAALHAHVALSRYTSSPKISRLWASSHGWFRPACAPLVETRKFKFRGMIYEKNDDYNNRYYCVFSKWLTCMVHRNMVWSDWIW